MIISTCEFSEIAKFCGNSQSIARYTQMNTKIFKTRPSQLRSVSNLQRCKIGPIQKTTVQFFAKKVVSADRPVCISRVTCLRLLIADMPAFINNIILNKEKVILCNKNR